MSTATVNIFEGVAAALIMLIIGAAVKHWLQTFRESMLEHLKPVRQLERNGGSHVADAVYEIRDALNEHLIDADADRRRLASLERRFSAHIREDSE